MNYKRFLDAVHVTQNEYFLGCGTRIWYARPPTQEDRDAKRYGTQTDLRMGYDWLTEERPALLARLRHADLDETHALVGEMGPLPTSRLPDPPIDDWLEMVYVAMQGCAWSPDGEARDLLEAAGIHHTSMSVGDIIEIHTGDRLAGIPRWGQRRARRFIVNGVGFVELTPGAAALRDIAFAVEDLQDLQGRVDELKAALTALIKRGEDQLPRTADHDGLANCDALAAARTALDDTRSAFSRCSWSASSVITPEEGNEPAGDEAWETP